MLSEQEKDELRAKLEVKDKELSELRARQHELHLKKEKAFSEKRKFSDKIISIARSLRQEKGIRNDLTKQVKDSKQRRGELNAALKDKIEEFKKVKAEKDALVAKLGIRFDPARIQKEIEDIEFKIETEGLPFKAEQQLMLRIRQKKMLLEETKEASAVFERAHVLSKEIDKIRTKADDAHKKIQTKANESQEHHVGLVENSKEIDELRKQEDAAFKVFLEAKKEWSLATDAVKAKFDEIDEIRRKLDYVKTEDRKVAAADTAHKIEEKKQSVEDKIKKRMTLTTEDLLAFQAQASDFNKGSEVKERDRPRKQFRRDGPRTNKK
jgi:uncharacterized coiled-coil DUF342 family protein